MWRPANIPTVRFYFLDRCGWPVELFDRQPIRNFIRLLLHTCRISTRWCAGTASRCNACANFDLRDIERLIKESDRIRNRTKTGGTFLPYTPLLAIRDLPVGSLNQKDLGVNRLGNLVLPLQPWPNPRSVDLVGPINGIYRCSNCGWEVDRDEYEDSSGKCPCCGRWELHQINNIENLMKPEE